MLIANSVLNFDFLEISKSKWMKYLGKPKFVWYRVNYSEVSNKRIALNKRIGGQNFNLI